MMDGTIVMLFNCISRYLCVYDKETLELMDEKKLPALNEWKPWLNIKMVLPKHSNMIIVAYSDEYNPDSLHYYRLHQGKKSY